MNVIELHSKVIAEAFSDIKEAVVKRDALMAFKLRQIQAYIALSQGTLYNPHLSEMLRELIAEVSR